MYRFIRGKERGREEGEREAEGEGEGGREEKRQAVLAPTSKRNFISSHGSSLLFSSEAEDCEHRSGL